MSGFPRRIVVKEEGSGALLGFVAIDSMVAGRARGGVTMMPDVSLDELEKLARAMTLKYGFLGLPQGESEGRLPGSASSR